MVYRTARRFLALLAAAALTSVGLSAVPPAASADEETVVRLGGSSRYTTATAISRALYGEHEASAVVLASGDAFADAAAGVALAAAKDAPLLLTAPTVLTGATATELDRVLAPGRTVYLLGGTPTLGTGVADAVAARGYVVRRLAGPDRYATAVAIAEAADRAPQAVFVATGLDFPDALTAGVAAGGVGVVVFTAGPRLPGPTRAYLDSVAAEPTDVLAVGAPAAAAAASHLDRRYVGDDRYATAALLAGALRGGASDSVSVASGLDFPDGLSGGVHAAFAGAPLLLSRPDALPWPSFDYVRSRRDVVDIAYVYGGTPALSARVVDDLRDAMTE